MLAYLSQAVTDSLRQWVIARDGVTACPCRMLSCLRFTLSLPPLRHSSPAATPMSSHSMLTRSAAAAALAALAPARSAPDVSSDDEIGELFSAATPDAAGATWGREDSSDDDIVELRPHALGPDCPDCLPPT